MKVRYLGHACFKVTSSHYSIIIDPYKDVNGFNDINNTANEVLCSHGHTDHAFTDGVELLKGHSPFTVEKIECFHDEVMGTKRGKNMIHVLTAENKKVVHLGDLGHLLDEETINKLKDCYILMVPVGGFYTIGPKEAIKIIEDLNPKYVIPMHYKDEDLGLGALADIKEFLSLYTKDNLLLVRGYEKEIEL